MSRNENGTKPCKLTDHHLTPSSRGGNGLARRILAISSEQHEAWHTLFGNATLEEAIEELNAVRAFFDDPANTKRRCRWKLSKTSFIPCVGRTSEGGGNHEDECNPLQILRKSQTPWVVDGSASPTPDNHAIA